MRKQRWMLRTPDKTTSRGADGVDNPFDAMRKAFGCTMAVEVKAMGNNAAVMRTNWLREEFFANEKGWLKPFGIWIQGGATLTNNVVAVVMAEDEIRAVQVIRLKHPDKGFAATTLFQAKLTDHLFSKHLFFQEVEYIRPTRKMG